MFSLSRPQHNAAEMRGQLRNLGVISLIGHSCLSPCCAALPETHELESERRGERPCRQFVK